MSDHAHAHHDRTPPAQGGQTATDPVCGMEVEIREDARTRHYDGRDFYFCSESCEQSFETDP